jgi:membrane-bound ClpP family serine protease
MTLTGIILLLLLGLIFLLLEILVLPGTTLLGVVGGILLLIGLWFTFSLYGTTVGLYTLGGTAIVSVALILLAFRANTWDRFTLHNRLDGKVNVINDAQLAVGTTGVAVSRLAPMGKAEFNGEYYEVTTEGEFVNPLTHIVIIAVSKSQIIVKPNTI